MNTPNEKALRLINAELKAIRVESRATRTLLGKINATLTELGSHVKGMQTALSVREQDFQAKHDELGQRIQTTHERVKTGEERVATVDRRLQRVERALKLRPVGNGA